MQFSASVSRPSPTRKTSGCEKTSILRRLADFWNISLGLGVLENESTTHFFWREPSIGKKDIAIFEPMKMLFFLQKARMILS